VRREFFFPSLIPRFGGSRTMNVPLLISIFGLLCGMWVFAVTSSRHSPTSRPLVPPMAFACNFNVMHFFARIFVGGVRKRVIPLSWILGLAEDALIDGAVMVILGVMMHLAVTRYLAPRASRLQMTLDGVVTIVMALLLVPLA